MWRPVWSAGTFTVVVVVVVVVAAAAVITYDLLAQPLVWCTGDDDAGNVVVVRADELQRQLYNKNVFATKHNSNT